jgi:glycosyltransferase involved in cell wall biosynthesis
MDEALSILMPTDAFPPKCGGAGWSAHALAAALIAAGHHATAIVPRRGAGAAREETLGVPAVRFGYRELPLPFVRNYTRHERLWPRFADQVAAVAVELPPPVVIHAQHVQAAPAAILAGKRLGAPVVVTVRDHWPWDYFATGLHGDRVPYERQTWASLAVDLPARLGALRGVAALLAIPYMRAHLARRQRFLRAADAVVAVSGYIADRLAGIVPGERIHRIPNLVDLAAVDRAIGAEAHAEPQEPFLLFVGKLERNKGAHLLVEIMRSAQAQIAPGMKLPPLVIAGDGALQEGIARELAALGVAARFLDWVAHDEILRLSARCMLFLYPSVWGEPLSRTLIEACACGAPIIAMPTGGTADILTNGVDGALEPTPERFARRMLQLLSAPAERRTLGAAARRRAATHFAAEVVVPQFVQLYRALFSKDR